MKNEKAVMVGYKGFSKGLICLKKQYKENSVFEEKNANICNNGMRFCDNPLAVFQYYSIKDNNEFTTVEALDKCDTNDNQKFCTKKLKIGVKVNIPTIIKTGINFIFEKSKVKTKNYSTSATSGDYSTSATSGDGSTSATSGDGSTSATSGYYSTSATSGDYSTSATSGYYSTSATSGDGSTSATSGYGSTSAVNDKKSIAIANGNKCKAKGVKGCYLVLSEYNHDTKEFFAKMRKVDGKHIKENVYYTLENGKFIKA